MSQETDLPTDRSDDAVLFEEQLVAYLDGELDQQATRELEARLASDPVARETLRRLERTWEMLDTLGRAETGDSFTRSTMEMVAVAAEKEVEQERQQLPVYRLQRWLLGICVLLAAGMLGYLSIALWWPDPNRQLLRDLPVIRHVDQYQEIGQYGFLQALYKEGLFADVDSEADDVP